MDIQLIAVGSRPWDLWFGYWGLSYLIDGTILYDAFSNYRVLGRKLRKAKIDPLAIQAIVLSHDHWDHVGGVWSFLKNRQEIDVYLPRKASASVKRHVLEEGGNLIDREGIKIIKKNIYLSDEMIGVFNNKAIAEQFLLVKGEKGFVVLVGCAHPGIVAIVQKAKETFGVPIYGVVGGFHLMHAKTDEIYACAHALKHEGIEMVSPTHCTGMRAEKIFKSVFRNGFLPSHEGQTLTL